MNLAAIDQSLENHDSSINDARVEILEKTDNVLKSSHVGQLRTFHENQQWRKG